MRKVILAVVCACSLFAMTGCFDSSKYHQDVDKQWLTKQVKEGKLSRTEADKLYIKIAQ